jgi:PAS domain S-box-containing protein
MAGSSDSASLGRQDFLSSLTEVLSSAVSPCLLLDAGFRILYANSPATRIAPHLSAAKPDATFFDAFPAASGSPLETALRGAMSEKTAASVVSRLQPLSGWFEWRAVPCGWGGIAMWFEPARAPVKLERKPRSVRARPREAPPPPQGVRRDPDPCVWQLHIPAMRAYATPGADALFGFDAPVEGGRPVEDYIARLHPDDRQRVREILDTAVREEGAFRAGGRVQLPDGTTRRIVCCGGIQRRRDGAPESLVGAFAEASNQEGALGWALVESRLEAFLERTPFGIVRIDESGKVRGANRVALELLGAAREDITFAGARWEDFTPPGGRELDAAMMEEARRRGSSRPCEREFLRKGGDPAPVLMSLAWEDGETTVFMLDVSELKRAEQERKALERRLQEARKLESVGVLAGGVAHDFNNMLVGIMGGASLALELLPSDSPARLILEQIVRTSEQAANITRQLLAYAGKGRFVVEPVSLSALAEETCALLKRNAPNSISFRLRLGEGLPLLDADPSQMNLVVMNLALNAMEAIGAGPGVIAVQTGEMSVDLRAAETAFPGWTIEPGRYVYLEMSDTGCGMDEATRDRIFDPFFTTKFVGRGLGLAAIAGIVRSHRGAISVETAPGAGSTFRVLFPAPGMGQDPKLAKAAKAGVVLVVDDATMVREFTVRALEREGYHALSARDSAEACATVRALQEPLSLAILDADGPHAAGPATATLLREIHPGLKILVTSDNDEAEALSRFNSMSVSGFLRKPYLVRDLTCRVRAALE